MNKKMIIGSLFVAIAVVYSVFVLTVAYPRAKRSEEQCTLQITGIVIDEDSVSSSSEIRYDALVEYEVNGTKYRSHPMASQLNHWTIGEEVVFYVDPDDPGVTRSGEGGPEVVLYVSLPIGAFFAFFGIVVIIVGAKEKAEKIRANRI